MYYGLYMSAAGAHAQSQRVEVLSNNLANVDTVGFKKELALLEARDAEEIERGLAQRGSRTATDIGGGIRMPTTATSYVQRVDGSASTGRLVGPNITFDPTATAISISPNGQVAQQLPGNPQLAQVGTLQLAMFPNPEGLLKLGENLYAATDASGQEQQVNPGQQGAGVLRQGFLEASNVELVHQLIDQITTQRSFELNSRAIQAGDQILQVISNLGRV